MALTGLALSLLLLPPRPVAAEEARVVGSVRIERRNVFDPSVPGEDWWVFRIANRIHILTREAVARRELLLNPGRPYEPIRALETERNLRSFNFIRQAEVMVSTETAGPVDLVLRTQDSWTLAPQLSAGTEGGDSFLIYGVQEGNLLGLGKTVSLFHSQVGPDVRNEARYVDPRFLGSRWAMTDLYAQTPRGDELGLLLDRPFFSLASLYSARVSASRIIEEDVLYRDALETSKFLQRYRAAQALGGLRLGDDEAFVRRAYAGWHYSRAAFAATGDTAPGTLPEGRELSGPLAGFAWVVPDYVKETNVDRMQRVEDFNLGNELSVSGGPMLGSFGSDRDRWIYAAQDQQGLRLAPGKFLLGLAGLRGRFGSGRPENVVAFGSANLFWKGTWPVPQTFVAHLEGAVSRRLDAENQLLLGGSTGLRGYKNNSFAGGRSALLNLESRFFHDRQYFHLVYLGAAAFFETGSVVPAGSPIAFNQLKSDVGLGLRLSPSRSSSGGVLRIDAAYALNRGPGPSRWVVGIRGGQAFSIFGSTARSALRTPEAALTEDSVARRVRRR